jgi:AmmeMemoRadiSam system protein B
MKSYSRRDCLAKWTLKQMKMNIALKCNCLFWQRFFSNCSNEFMLRHSDYTIIPILVGSLSHQQLEEYGRIFSAYLNDPQCLLVISSDFCHWGSRFQYTYLPTRHDPIYKGIERMDLEATSILQQVDVNGFSDYLSKTQNTICGKFPIFILLKALSMTQHQWKPQLLHYQQSSQVRDMNDSSVSYVSMAFQ